MEERLPKTEIVVNTFPEVHLNKRFIPLHGNALNFTKQKGILYFQPHVFFRVLDYDTNEKVYEFRTVSSYEWDKKLLDFMTTEFALNGIGFIKAAIGDFNWYIKRNKSFLTMDKFYSHNITVENSANHIRSAYIRYRDGLNIAPRGTN